MSNRHGAIHIIISSGILILLVLFRAFFIEIYTQDLSKERLKKLTNKLTFKSINRGAFDSAKKHKRQRHKRQSVTTKREKSQKPKFV